MTTALLSYEDFAHRPTARRAPFVVRHARPLSPPSFDDQEQQALSMRVPKLAAVVGLHAALVVWMMDEQVRMPPEPLPIRMEVRSIEAPPTSQVGKPVAEAPKPLPQVARPVARRPRTATPPSVIAAAPGRNAPPAAFAVSPPAATRSTEEAALAPPAPAPATPPVTAARFDADYLQNPSPPYPAMSRRLREEGKVMLDVKVTVAGEPEQVRLKQSSGFPRLDDAAINTVQRWRFLPARQGSETVAASVVVPVVFRLDI
jgi:protein TonB